MAQQHPSPESVQPKPHVEDEIVHTPTKHRARWIMGILLLILILTTFTVGDEITGLLTGRGRGSAYATWNRPGMGQQSISNEDWQGCLRSLTKLYSVLGNQQLKDSEITQEVASTLVVGALAEDAGIAVTDTELGEFIVAQFGSAQNYRVILPQYRVTPKEFESTLRQRLVLSRYTSLVAGGWNTPDPAEVEKAWKIQHQEYAFDFSTMPVEVLAEDSGAAAITDEELHAYFDALPQPKKDSFKSKQKIAADCAGVPYEGASTAALLAQFPAATDEAELEKQAQAYYDGVGLRRFTGKPFAEVKERARVEAQTLGALQAWLKEMRSREERGIAVNFAADASALGVSTQHMPAALEQSEWIATKPAPWVGSRTVSRLFGDPTGAVAGKFCPDVIVDETGFTIVQVTDNQGPAMPPFEQFADKLREDVRKKRTKDLALQSLEKLRDQFGTRPAAVEGQPAPAFMPEADEAKFNAVMGAAGFTVQLRDFRPRPVTPTEIANDPIEMYARTQPGAYNAKPGSVLPAGTDSEGRFAFLVRARGTRDPDLAQMKPGEFANVSATLQSASTRELRQKAFTLSALQSRYGLVFNTKRSAE